MKQIIYDEKTKSIKKIVIRSNTPPSMSKQDVSSAEITVQSQRLKGDGSSDNMVTLPTMRKITSHNAQAPNQLKKEKPPSPVKSNLNYDVTAINDEDA